MEAEEHFAILNNSFIVKFEYLNTTCTLKKSFTVANSSILITVSETEFILKN